MEEFDFCYDDEMFQTQYVVYTEGGTENEESSPETVRDFFLQQTDWE